MPARTKHGGRWSLRRFLGSIDPGRPDAVLSASAFESAFKRERSLATRTARSFALVVFVPSSDAASDYERLAEVVVRRVRESDLVGELSPGRLALLLPETTESGAHALMDVLLVDLGEHAIETSYRLFMYPSSESGDRASVPREGEGAGSNGRSAEIVQRPIVPDSLPPHELSMPSVLEHAASTRNGRVHGAGATSDVGAARTAGRARSQSGAGRESGQATGRLAPTGPRRMDDGSGAFSLDLMSDDSGVIRLAPRARRDDSDAGVARTAGECCDLAGIRDLVGRAPAASLSELIAEPISARRRALDILVSGTALVLLSPLFLLVAAAIKLTSRGPVFYRQKRAGLGGEPFWFYKFRSMAIDADARKGELQNENEKDGPIFKMRNDPRITWIGRIIRPLSIDELPQLYNVFRGDMTLIGPRPATLDEVAEYEPWQRERLNSVGGLTCIWQVSGRSEVSFDDWMRMDRRYQRDRSLRMDISLLFRTVTAVLSRRGAY